MKALKTIIAATLVTGIASTNALATSFPDFTIDESAVAGTGTFANQFTADKITGNYVEIATFNTTDNTFDVSIQWSAGQFVGNDGSTVVTSLLGASFAPQYQMYALFQANGTFSVSGGATSFTFNPGGSLDLWIDAFSDTIFSDAADGASAWGTTNISDDVLIATGGVISGFGLLDPTLATCTGGGGINCGSFGTTNNFNLTAAGENYFTGPRPFFEIQVDSGQLNNFIVDDTQKINGSFDVVFKAVPEPASLALMGLGLIGIRFSSRKKA